MSEYQTGEIHIYYLHIFFYHAFHIRYIFTSEFNLSSHQFGGILHVVSQSSGELSWQGCGFVSLDVFENRLGKQGAP